MLSVRPTITGAIAAAALLWSSLAASSSGTIAATDEDFQTDIRPFLEQHCFVCHGATAVSGGVLPDLRLSLFIRDTEAFRSVVIDGVLAQNGMVSFAENLSKEEAEAVRAYIIRRANESADER